MMQSMTAALCAARDPQSPTKPDPAKLSRTFFVHDKKRAERKNELLAFQDIQNCVLQMDSLFSI